VKKNFKCTDFDTFPLVYLKCNIFLLFKANKNAEIGVVTGLFPEKISYGATDGTRKDKTKKD
jgi:hypothetical protein